MGLLFSAILIWLQEKVGWSIMAEMRPSNMAVPHAPPGVSPIMFGAKLGLAPAVPASGAWAKASVPGVRAEGSVMGGTAPGCSGGVTSPGARGMYWGVRHGGEAGAPWEPFGRGNSSAAPGGAAA